MERKHKKIALLHHTGCGNLGDDAIIDVVISNIRQRWDDAEFMVFSMNPDDTVMRHGIPSLPIRRYTWDARQKSAATETTQRGQQTFGNWLKKARNPIVRLPRAAIGELAFLIESYRILRSFDLLIVSGGGQLTERGGPWSFPYALFVWSVMAKLAGVRFIFLSVGAGPLNHPLSRFFVPKALRAAEYVSFRDKESQDLATEIGFAGEGHVFPDNVYAFDVPASSRAAKRANRPVVGVAPMPYPFSDHLQYPSDCDAIQDELIGKIANFVSSLAGQSYSIELFGSDTKADPPAIEDLRKVLLNRHHIPTPQYLPLESVSELVSRMSSMDYVVTCRFHGVVFGHLLNKPVLAIAHHPKVTHLMNALGLSEYCVDMDNFSPDQLTDRFASLVRNAETVKKIMAANVADFRLKLAMQFDSLFPPGSTQYARLQQSRRDSCQPTP
jgi:polysaccharide pyruvyl transferase WcaK-like protein